MAQRLTFWGDSLPSKMRSELETTLLKQEKNYRPHKLTLSYHFSQVCCFSLIIFFSKTKTNKRRRGKELPGKIEILLQSLFDILNLACILNCNKEEKCDLFFPLHDKRILKKPNILCHDFVYFSDIHVLLEARQSIWSWKTCNTFDTSK